MTQAEIRAAIEKLTGANNGILKNIGRDEWQDLQDDTRNDLPEFNDDESNPVFIFSGISNELLGMIAKGQINMQDLAKRTLEGRGYDTNNNWVGFNHTIK